MRKSLRLALSAALLGIAAPALACPGDGAKSAETARPAVAQQSKATPAAAQRTVKQQPAAKADTAVPSAKAAAQRLAQTS